jgi:hypothetical protein
VAGIGYPPHDPMRPAATFPPPVKGAPASHLYSHSITTAGSLHRQPVIITCTDGVGSSGAMLMKS